MQAIPPTMAEAAGVRPLRNRQLPSYFAQDYATGEEELQQITGARRRAAPLLSRGDANASKRGKVSGFDPKQLFLVEACCRAWSTRIA